MNLVRVGRRWINLTYLIYAEDIDPDPDPPIRPPADTLRLTLLQGLVLGFTGADASLLRLRLSELVSEPPASSPGPESGEAPGESGESGANSSASSPRPPQVPTIRVRSDSARKGSARRRRGPDVNP